MRPMPKRTPRLALALGAGLTFAAPRFRLDARGVAPAAPEVLAKHQQLLCGKPQAPASSSAAVGLQAHPTLAGRLLVELSSRGVGSAASAGVVAALVMTVLSSIMDPLKERFLRRRVYKGSKPASVPCFPCLSLCIQLIKFPLFEPLLLWALTTSLLPFASPLLRAALAGVAFAVFTLPFTNFRMGASNRSYARGSWFKSFLPTVARDTVYAVTRAALPAMIIAHCSTKAHRLTAFMPEVLFPSVFVACLLAAPLNELRDYSLANRSASEFFLPLKYAFFAVIRSAGQALSLVLGYRYAPVVVRQMTEMLGHWKATKAFVAHWKAMPNLELWALAGIGSLAMLASCLAFTKFKRLSRSQSDRFRDMLMES